VRCCAAAGWRLDYFTVSKGLFPRVKEVVVHSDVLGSDHCPLTCVLGPA